MLRAFGLQSRWEGLSVRGLLRRAAEPAAWLLAAAALARVQPVGGLAPFALALLAAGGFAGVRAAAILAGCLAAIPDSGALWAAPAGMAATLLTSAGAQGLGQWLQARDGRASPRKWADGAAALAAALGVLGPGVPLAAGGTGQSLRVAGAALAAAAAAPFFRALLGVTLRRRHLMPEERVGGAILALAALAGLAGLWLPAALTAVLWFSLVLAPMGGGAGACTGLSGGLAMALAAGLPQRAAALGLCGLLAGGAAARKSWAAPAALAAGMAVCVPTMGLPLSDLICAMAACAAAMVTPEAFSRRVREWAGGETQGACDPDRLARRLRAETERKLRAMSAAFGELADGYRDPVDMPDEQALICEMRARLCEGCSRYPACWAGDDNRAVRFLCQLISESVDWAAGGADAPLFGDELPPDVLRQCARGRTIPARLGDLLEEFSKKRRSELKRGAVSQLISAQFTQAQLLLRGMADVQARPMRVRGRQAARARAALDRAGLEVTDVMALRGARRMEIVAALKEDELWTPETAAEASAQLSRVFGRPYAPDGEPGGAEMKFVRLPRLRASAGSACRALEADMPSGDSHIVRTLDGDRLMLMLSDGMGSGEAAARESAQTLRLLSRFLAADVARPLALETVNELMLARSETDMFATVDLCVVDLLTGSAEFTKLAACRSLILRGNEVIEVDGGRLPLGILERVQPSNRRVRLQPGDVIVLASDGVMDAVDGDALCECLLRHGHQPPKMLAETLLDLAEREGDPRRRDDRTVLCARIAQRRAA